MNVAFFVTPHGFGHAARASAVAEEILIRNSSAHVHIFSRVPEWFFRQSLPGYRSRSWYHELQTDVGFVQKNSLTEDVPATLRELGKLYPLSDGLVSGVARKLKELDVRIVVSDIAAMGALCAETADIPSVLVENFTWDWIYHSYRTEYPDLVSYMDLIRSYTERFDLRIQSQPVCEPVPGAVTVGPIARKRRSSADEIRRKLDISETAKLILLSMGGVSAAFEYRELFARTPEYTFVLSGVDSEDRDPGNVRTVAHQSDISHPDLVAAADAVVGKVGYSTVAEAYHGRTQFLFVSRPRFRESSIMENFVSTYLNGHALTSNEFETGTWIEMLPSILRDVTKPAEFSDGAEEAAKVILGIPV